MKDISTNIKRVLMVFLICFMALISYITYFEIVIGPSIVNSPYNRRLWVKRNEVLRGTIYDRNGTPLTKSVRINQETQKREYTGGAMFTHVLGYEDIKYGITGLERKYDEQLMSTNVQDTIRSLIENKGKEPPKIGNSLKTTLDYNVQETAYNLLGNNRGAVVALNPKTGEILTMVSKPSFDPNNLDQIWKSINADKNKPLINRATAGLYPPGSTFKMVTAISALENISDIQSRTFNDTGSLYLGPNYSLHNFEGEALGNIGFADAFKYSDNVVFGTIGLELGNDRLKTTAEKFFFNKEIPADGIPVEPSLFPTLKSYQKGDIAQSAIGQSQDLASPLQMAVIASTIANNGVMMRPYLVQDVVSNTGQEVQNIAPQSLGQIISVNTANTMKDLMRDVVNGGTGVNAAINGIQVCGKTGTADHQDEGKNAPPHSWFVGFAPYNDPQVAVAVIVEDGGQGGIAAARIASGVMKVALGK
jgi:peptidoglycan glycosyltransferase